MEDETVKDYKDCQRDPIVTNYEGSVENWILQKLNHAFTRTLKIEFGKLGNIKNVPKFSHKYVVFNDLLWS